MTIDTKASKALADELVWESNYWKYLSGAQETSVKLLRAADTINALCDEIDRLRAEVERLRKQARCGHHALDKRTYSSCPCGFHQIGERP